MVLSAGFICICQSICDCARQYAERIETILEKNRYYDAEQENQFDVKDQVSDAGRVQQTNGTQLLSAKNYHSVHKLIRS